MKALFLLLLLQISLGIYSQSIRLVYDGAGNRVLRVVSSSNDVVKKSRSTVDDISSLELVDGKVTVSPNPTSGSLRIDIADYNQFEKYEAYIFNSAGQQLYSKKINADVTDMDISAYSAGVYIVAVRIGDKCEITRVVKQ